MEHIIKAVISNEKEINGIIQLEPLRGPQGLSAYEIYVNHLPAGQVAMSETEWLDSLSKINYYKQYKQIYKTTEDNTTIVPILISAYNETCLLDIYLNGLRLNDDEYSVNVDKKIVTLTTPINKKQTIDIIVSKTIVAKEIDYNFLRGEKGEQGIQGEQGPQGLKGEKGPKGEKGDIGIGIPNGGSVGQVLVKNSENDYDFMWSDFVSKDNVEKNHITQLYLNTNINYTKSTESIIPFNRNVVIGTFLNHDTNTKIIVNDNNVKGLLISAHIDYQISQATRTTMKLFIKKNGLIIVCGRSWVDATAYASSEISIPSFYVEATKDDYIEAFYEVSGSNGTLGISNSPIGVWMNCIAVLK